MPEDVKPVEITLGDGSVVKGANMDEAFKNLAKMKEDTSAELKRQREQTAMLQTQQDNLSAQVDQLKNPPRVDDGKSFAKDKYYELLNSDPIAAQDYIDRYRWDADPVQVRAQFVETVQRVDALTQQTVAATFLQKHSEDFPPDAEASRKLTQRVSELVNNQGFRFTPDTLDYAYTQLVSEDVIKPLEPKRQQQDDIVANPSLTGGGGNISASELAQIDKMTDKDLEALMRSKGMLR